jgi:hypothetical protein
MFFTQADGKFRQTRDGRKAEITGRNTFGHWVGFVEGLGLRFWESDGLFLHGAEHPLDLVSIWKDGEAQDDLTIPAPYYDGPTAQQESKMDIERIDNPTLEQLQTGDEVHVKPVTIMRIEGDHVWCKLFSGQEVPVEASHIEYVTRAAAPVPGVGDVVTWWAEPEWKIRFVDEGWWWLVDTRNDRMQCKVEAVMSQPSFRIVRRASPPDSLGRPYQ